MVRPNGNAPGILYARVPIADMRPVPAHGPVLRVIDAAAPARHANGPAATIAPFVDTEWYNGAYRDIAAVRMDPVVHYAQAGWREGRRPFPEFDPAWYLQTYPDIREAGIDPLQHYISAGHAEGRLPHRPGDRLRAVLEMKQREAAHTPVSMAPPDAPTLGAADLRRLIAEASRAAFGFVLSLSHDRYIDITGGIELVVADEQQLFATARFTYLHISPEVPAMTLAAEGPGPQVLQLVLDGRFIGLADATVLREALAAEAAALPPQRLFVVHSFFGHRGSDLPAFAAAIEATHRLFWLHDFGAICEGFNLLRNGLQFCSAPAPDSTACRVCVHGANREAYQRAVQRMFTSLRPTLVSPSHSALALFRQVSDLPIAGAVVHPNAALTADAPVPMDRPHIGTAQDPIRVAFVGYPLPHKGWPGFQRLTEALADDPRVRLYHFAAPDSLSPRHGLTCVPAQATAQHRTAMVEALRHHQIDLVLLLSPWPETFSFVTHEAIAAGADVITYGVSGNAAAAVRRYGRGVVLEDEDALMTFFASGAVFAYMRAAARDGRQYGALRLIGTTATLDPAADTRPHLELPTTTEPRLTVLAGARKTTGIRQGWDYDFALPEGTQAVRLLSRRALGGRGVLVTRLLLDGRVLHLDDPAFGAGWLGAELGGRLTNGDASLATGGATRLQISLRQMMRYPALPLDAD